MPRIDIDVVKKSVTLDQEELEQLKVILGAKSDSEAIRRVIHERLAIEGALAAHRRLVRPAGRRRRRVAPVELVEWR